jgi:internalin A
MYTRQAVTWSMAVLAWALAGPAQADEGKAGPPLPEEVVRAAWKRVGASLGWMAQDRLGRLVFQERPGKGTTGKLPAIQWRGWRAGVVGKLPLGRPFGLDLSDSVVHDAGLNELAALKQLHWLNLTRTKVTDAGLKELAALKELRALDLTDTKVTDAGLKELAALKQLQALRLFDTRVTDAGLKELAALKQLRTLGLHYTAVTDARLKDLAPLKQLHTLVLDRRKVTDATLRNLWEVGLLHALDLAGGADDKRPMGTHDIRTLYLPDT